MTGMLTGKELAFGPYRLDAANARLLRDGRPVAITPKAFDVLHHLASRAQRLVTKDELLSAVWPDVIVSDASIKVCVREIRKALDDEAKTPTYIETVHRRGYRFIAEVAESGGPPPAATRTANLAAAAAPTPETISATAPSTLVGRDAELRQLNQALHRAHGGRRQCVFVSGGAGSGKTALADAFVRIAAVGGQVVLLTGHCFEQFGTSEPYMPVWEAIGALSRQRPSPGLSALLARHAAAYAGTAPPSRDGSATRTEPRGTTERLLREIADGIEQLAAEATVVLWLEDVHWADYSTIDLLSALARRRAPARLLVLATYRPAEVLAGDHPLRGVVQGLLTAGLGTEVALDFLDESSAAQFLAARFPGNALPPALARRLHQRTEGHPLFLVHLVDDLVAQGVIAERDGRWQLAGGDDDTGWLEELETQVPQTVRAMILAQLERLGRDERQVLEAAAVAGVEFSAAAVGAAVEADVVSAEQLCDDLARRHRFLEPRGVAEWPDGAAATRFRFVHDLYHNVVYEQVPVARRGRLHQLVGQRIEAAWGERAAEEAAGLAMHFEMARDWERAWHEIAI